MCLNMLHGVSEGTHTVYLCFHIYISIRVLYFDIGECTCVCTCVGGVTLSAVSSGVERSVYKFIT